jgi:hypothetical protein
VSKPKARRPKPDNGLLELMTRGRGRPYSHQKSKQLAWLRAELAKDPGPTSYGRFQRTADRILDRWFEENLFSWSRTRLATEYRNELIVKLKEAAATSVD